MSEFIKGLESAFLTVEQAKLINRFLKGEPTENRIVVATPLEHKHKSGLVIPGNTEDGIPKKGVVVQRGYIDDQHITYKEQCEVGRVVTYGLYSGKELELDLICMEGADTLPSQRFTVLQLAEIMYSEPNKK